MEKIISTIVFSVNIILVILFGGFLLNELCASSDKEKVQSLTGTQRFTAEMSQVDETVVEESPDLSNINIHFSEISELAVEEYRVSCISEYQEDPAKFWIFTLPFTDCHFLIMYDGIVSAGIRDFDSVVYQIVVEEKRIVVTAPYPELLSVSIDESSIEVRDQSNNWFNQLETSDVFTFLSSEEGRIGDEAIADGLLERAKNRTQVVIEEYLNSIINDTDIADYKIEFNWLELES